MARLTLPVTLQSLDGYSARITNHGELIVAPASPNTVQHHSMTSINTAYSFAPPIAGSKMLLQNILMYGNKGIGTNDATVIIYTANSETSTAPIDVVLELELPKYANRDLIGLNLELPVGVYLNAKTNDATVFLTMLGYYIEV